MNWMAVPSIALVLAVVWLLSRSAGPRPVRRPGGGRWRGLARLNRRAPRLHRSLARLVDTLPAPTTAGFQFATVGVVVLACVVAVLAFGRSVSTTGTHLAGYRHTLVLDYSGTAPTSLAYPEGRFGWGDPLYTALADDVVVTARYSLDSAHRGPTTGRLALSADLVGANGWRGQLAPAVQVPLDGALATTGRLTLSLDQVAALATEVERITGAPLGGLTVAIRAQVDLTTTIEGQPIATSYDQILTFRREGGQLVLVPRDATATRSDSLSLPDRSPAVLRWGFLAVPVWSLRVLALVLVGFALVLAATIAVLRCRPPGLDFEMAHRYHERLVEVQGLETGLPIVDLATPADLMRLADQTGGLVLHYGRGTLAEGYVLEHGAACYRYAGSLSTSG